MRISLEHLSIEALAANLRRHVRYGFRNTATVLALIAEMDERKLYLELGYPSMYAYCVGELHFSEDGARKRIHAARAARRIPALLSAIEDGRLHLSAVVLLAPCLTSENATELLAAATHKTKREVEQLVAEWFPRLDEPSCCHRSMNPSMNAPRGAWRGMTHRPRSSRLPMSTSSLRKINAPRGALILNLNVRW